MGLRDTLKERFSVLLGSGAVEDEMRAYIEAYETKGITEEGVRKRANEVLSDPAVRKRIIEVQEATKTATIERTIGSDVWLLDKLRVCIEGATTRGQYGVAIRGIELAARHPSLNLFPQRVDHYRQKDPLEGKTPAEIRELAMEYGVLKRPDPKRLPQGEVVDVDLVDGSDEKVDLDPPATGGGGTLQ